MTDPNAASNVILVRERECAVFSRYLVGRDPGQYVVRKYVEGQESAAFRDGVLEHPLDPTFLRFAGLGVVAAKMADAYARFFAPRCIFRRKLILLLAILESSSPTNVVFSSPVAARATITIARLASDGLGFFLSFLLGMIVFLPVHAMSVAVARRSGGAARIPVGK